MVNIFYLDEDIDVNCRYHCDRHISKMIVESTQILSAVCRLYGQSNEEAPYGIHSNKHPAVLWAAASRSNWLWLHKFTLALNKEFQFRYDKTKDHLSASVCKTLKVPTGLEDVGITERPQAMPEQYRVKGDPVQAYRNYYIGEKQYFAKWKTREVPEWYREGCLTWNQMHPNTPQTMQEKKAMDQKLKMERDEEKKRKRQQREEEKQAKKRKTQ